MRLNFSALFSQVPSSDTVPAGGGAAPAVAPPVSSSEEVEDAPPATPEPSAEEPPAAPAPSVSVIDRAKALMKSKPTLQAENTQLRADNSAYQSQISEMQAKIQRLESTNDALHAEAVEFEKLVSQAEAEKLTVTQTATQIVANAGVPLEELPAQEVAGEDSLEVLNEKLAATTDPVEKGKLAAKIRALR